MKNLRKKIAGLVIAASIMSIGVVTMAATSGTTSDSKGAYQSNAEGGHGGKGGFAKDGIGKGNMENTLKSLVSAGTITQEQSDKIVGYMSTLETNKPAKDSTAADSSQKKSPLSAVVDDGTLTQAQLDEVSKVVHFGGHGKGGNGDKGMGKESKAPASDASTNQAS